MPVSIEIVSLMNPLHCSEVGLVLVCLIRLHDDDNLQTASMGFKQVRPAVSIVQRKAKAIKQHKERSWLPGQCFATISVKMSLPSTLLSEKQAPKEDVQGVPNGQYTPDLEGLPKQFFENVNMFSINNIQGKGAQLEEWTCENG